MVMSNEELVSAIQGGKGDRQELLGELYSQNFGAIRKICKKYEGAVETDDALQEAYFGICKAAEMWTPEGGASFIGYAGFWIRQSILRYLANNGSCVRVPSHQLRKIRGYNRTVNAYRVRFGRDPSDRELCALLELTPEQLDTLRRDAKMLYLRSTDEVIDEDGETTLGDLLQDKRDFTEDIEQKEMASCLWGEVDSLPAQQSAVIRDRFQNDHTFNECAVSLGCTPQQVKSLHDKALRELRKPRHTKHLRPYLTEQAAYSQGIKHTGYTSFMHYGSAQEHAVMEMERRTGMNLYHGKEIMAW